MSQQLGPLLLASVIDSLAWPALVGFLAFQVRDQIGQLVGRLSRLRYKELEAEFREALREIDVQSDEVIEGELLDPAQVGTIALFDLAEVSPRAAVLEAWIKIENATRDYYEFIGMDRRLSYQAFRNLPRQHLERIKSVLGPYKELKELRNKASHSSDFDLSPEIAREYIAVASRVEYTLRKAAS